VNDHLIPELQLHCKGSASVFRRRALSRFLLVFLPLGLELPAAQAQQEFSRIEIGGQFSAIGLLNANGDVGIWPGFGWLWKRKSTISRNRLRADFLSREERHSN
jgi:hypothetical protein